jgi:predicted DNA-binding transcriptional regulator AlpA
MTPKLKVARIAPPTTEAPAIRGQLLTDAEVARMLKLENPESANTRRWVRQHVPKKKRLGHLTVRWFEADVMEWVASTGTDDA